MWDTEEERNKLFHSKVVSVICTILLSASDEATSAKPFFPIDTVLAAMNHVPNQKDAQKNKELLWGQASCCNCHPAILSCSQCPAKLAVRAAHLLSGCMMVAGSHKFCRVAVLDVTRKTQAACCHYSLRL